ncbi:ABC transporter permease [Pseudomonas fragi]|jgi:putative ABC transport system permease protein|uniref:ABC transporter permease n=1 Tax=Pseudomonas fragi TaxID=296 RepID=A0A9Q5B0F7_PSEFR|nr:ABC transporter permease [Pseudomonas fragi]MBM1202269.1 ABC transporter permease [Pseudomonas fragi]NNB26054.1 ABC transporter permease [Pseudomonas fragi]NNB34449.1 ABC transporter permease [Pseudomonas fragi]NNB50010.1 ABC transporter permease [Pseudomonas fragi]PAA10164.1 ABC transporter permease [Pseudomonas fragi]
MRLAGSRQVVGDAIDTFRTLGKRTVLALLGIVIGSASIVAILNIGFNAGQEATRIFHDMGVDTLVASLNNDRGVDDSLLSTEVEKIRSLNLPGLVISPVAQVSVKLTFNHHPVDARAVGVEPAVTSILKLPIRRGRFLHALDTAENVVVLGHAVATSLVDRGIAVEPGEWVRINTYLFRVAGVLQPAEASMISPVLTDHSVFMPFAALARVAQSSNVSTVLARVLPPLDSSEGASRVFEGLSHAFKTRRVEMTVPQQMIDAMARQNKTFEYLLLALGVITLVGAGVAVMNVMYMNVCERRNEIGLRMAIGARGQDIRNLFLIEALALSAMGALSGACVGIVLAWLYAVISQWTFELSMVSIPLGVGSTLLVGVFSGLKPALAASRLTPVEALRVY